MLFNGNRVSVWDEEKFYRRMMGMVAQQCGVFCFSFRFFNLFIYLFIYFWLCWVFVAACGLSLAAASGGDSLLQCAGFSWQWLLLLWSTGSRRVGFSSCGTWAQ